MHDRLRGIFPPIPTTFEASTGDVDEQAVAANVRRWMKTGLAGVLALGSNGEAGSLDDAESDRLVAAVRAEIPRDRLLPGHSSLKIAYRCVGPDLDNHHRGNKHNAEARGDAELDANG